MTSSMRYRPHSRYDISSAARRWPSEARDEDRGDSVYCDASQLQRLDLCLDVEWNESLKLNV